MKLFSFLLLIPFLFCLSIKSSGADEAFDQIFKRLDGIEKNQKDLFSQINNIRNGEKNNQNDIKLITGSNSVINTADEQNNDDMQKSLLQKQKEDKQADKKFTHFAIGSVLVTLFLGGITIQYGKHCKDIENNETLNNLKGLTGTVGLVSTALLLARILTFVNPNTAM